MYDYTEYRVMDDTIKICNAADNFVRSIWKMRNSRVKKQMSFQGCRKSFHLKYYVVSKQFHVYWAPAGQYFPRNDYGVIDGELHVCEEKLQPISLEYTTRNLSTCNDSIINIKYDDEYKVWNDFSILYKNKMYDYTEYRVLNDIIKICNSTDDFVRNIWKIRNSWVKEQMHLRNCKKPDIFRTLLYYFVSKQFYVYRAGASQYFTRNYYGVIDGKPRLCKENLRPVSREYTKEDLLTCNDSIINIKYDDEYKVWNNFSILYKNKVYDYTEYRVLNDTIKICNSTDNHVRNIWKIRNDWVKKQMSFKGCNKATTFHYYVVSKQFLVYWAKANQYFTRNEQGVIHGKPYTCKEKLRPVSTEYTKDDLLTCNDSIINIKYDDEYKVWNNFSVLYKNKVYDYTEYRVLNDIIKICNSTDYYVRNIWKIRNYWVKGQLNRRDCERPDITRTLFHYVADKQFNVYWAPADQYFTGNDYGVIQGRPRVCKEKLRPESTEYTKEDLLTCNDSIINIKYDDEYKVWNNFSILYKNKVYDYTEYRVLNDTIKICNSTDNYVRDIWKIRNYWVEMKLLGKESHALRRQLYFKVKKYLSYLHIKNITPTCNDSIINIKYDDEYKVWNNFSILYKNKMYDYTEYRVLHNGIKICNSTDNYVRNIWKMRNYSVKWGMNINGCNVSITSDYYVVTKQFRIYWAPTGQYFTRNDFGVNNGQPQICEEKLRPVSAEYTKEDLITCNESIINIKYDDEYKVWNNFSILYKNKVYDYTEYRVLNDSIKICNSTDDYVRNIWKMRNYLVKKFIYFESCNKSVITKTDKRGDFPLLKGVKLQENTKIYRIYNTTYDGYTGKYTAFNVSILLAKKVTTKYRFSVMEGKFIICSDKRMKIDISDIRLSFIAPFCALALSIICLLLLLIVYGMLPELRTLPGLNLMSLSFSFLLALTNYVVYLPLYLRVGKELDFPCARLEITNKFITYNILMNAAVNIYHLRKTFCRNTLVKSDENKIKTFFKYSVFSWGIPVLITIVYIVLVKTKVFTFYQHITQRSAYCDKGHDIPHWLVVVENYGVPGCLLFYIIAMFIFAAYQIRQKLKASKNIIQKSNIVKNRRSFVLLLKLSTTTAISWIPLVFEDLVFNSDLMITLLTVAWLTGVYVGIAFVFTRKNYQLLRKKYFSEQVSK